MRNLIFLSILFVALGCASIPQAAKRVSVRVPVGPGPEDMVLDTVSGAARLLISCSPRRPDQKGAAGIYALDMRTEEVTNLPRKGEPEAILFRPHGISLSCSEEGCYLYVISHEESDVKHLVLKYRVEKDHLQFMRKYAHPLLTSPNALTAMEDGSFYVSNDADKAGDWKEMILKLKRSQLVYCDGEANWQVAAEDALAMGNGIVHKDDVAYVATTRGGKLYQYELEAGKLSNRQLLAKAKGADNLRFYDDELLLPVHLKSFAFIKHVKDSTNHSPSVVYQIDPQTKSRRVIYANKGDEISATSTAIIYQGHLYLSQVFDSFILKVNL